MEGLIMYASSPRGRRVENGLVGLIGIMGAVALVIVGVESCEAPAESAPVTDCSLHGHDQAQVWECMNQDR